MAISAITKNSIDGALVLTDNSGTPKTLTLKYTGGDLKVSGLRAANRITTVYKDRGIIYAARATEQAMPNVSFTAHFTDLSDVANRTLHDMALKYNSMSAGVSTLGSTANGQTALAGDVWTIDGVWTVTGIALGDPSDHTLSLYKIMPTSFDISEGTPNTFSLTGEVLGVWAST